MERVLEGSKPVLDLLEKNPFPDRPPNYLRSLLYEYCLSDKQSKKEGKWWICEPAGNYTPIMASKDVQLPPHLKPAGTQQESLSQEQQD
jgi:hypothetical protein